MRRSKKPLRYRGLSRKRTERAARVLGKVYPLLVAVVIGLFAVLRVRNGNVLAGLPLWVVLSIGVTLGVWLWVIRRYGDPFFHVRSGKAESAPMQSDGA